MAHIAVKNGKPKWVPLKWLSCCDPASLLCKVHDPWVGQYNKRSTLQPVPESGSESPGDQTLERLERNGDTSSLPLGIAAERTKFDDKSIEYTNVAPTEETVEQISTDSSGGEELEEKFDDPSAEMFSNDDSFQSMPPESPMEGEIGDQSDTEMEHSMKASLPSTAGRKRSLKLKVLFPSEGKICSRTQSKSCSLVTALVQAVQRPALAKTEQCPNRRSIMMLNC